MELILSKTGSSWAMELIFREVVSVIYMWNTQRNAVGVVEIIREKQCEYRKWDAELNQSNAVKKSRRGLKSEELNWNSNKSN